MKRWYCVHTHTAAEAAAEGQLARQGFGTYLPRCLKRRRHARRTTLIHAPLFPRYLFVQIDLGRARWKAINSTYGVKDLVCMGDRPAAVPEGVIAGIRVRENEEGLVPLPEKPPFRPGEAVRVTGGPLVDLSGVFDCLDDRERVVVLLGLLGRELRVPLHRDAVAATG